MQELWRRVTKPHRPAREYKENHNVMIDHRTLAAAPACASAREIRITASMRDQVLTWPNRQAVACGHPYCVSSWPGTGISTWAYSPIPSLVQSASEIRLAFLTVKCGSTFTVT